MKLLTALLFVAIATTLPAEESKKIDLKRDLELWLPLQDGFRDYSKNRHIGEVMGNLRIERDGAYFDGRGDHIIFPSFDFKNRPFAIAMWIKITGDFGNYGILQQKGANRKNEWLHLMLRDRMNPFFSFYVGNTRGERTFRNSDGWQHLLVQFTGEAREIYVDGKLDVSMSARPFQGKGGPLIIGLTPKWTNVPAMDFEGYLTDFRIYSRSLSRREIRYLASMSSE